MIYKVLYFPRVARGHGTKRREDTGKLPCCKGGGEARFDAKGNYSDGHFASQAVQERAHREGLR